MANPNTHTGMRDWAGCTKCRLHRTRRSVIARGQWLVHCPTKAYLPCRNNGEHIGIEPIVPLSPSQEVKAWWWLHNRPRSHSLSPFLFTPLPPSSFIPPNILILGEAPGESEDAKGTPFYGIAGNILKTILAYSKMSAICTITNTVCCRPVHTEETTPDSKKWRKNRQPEESEQDLCKDHFLELVLFHRPSGILVLGEIAKKYYSRLSAQLPSLPNLHLMHPASIARMDYKLHTIKLQARELELWLKTLPARKP